MNQSRTVFLLGGTGFIGARVVAEAVAAGITVKALARSPESAAALTKAGARAVTGEAQDSSRWGAELSGADTVIDLVQPPLPKRMSAAAIMSIVATRESVTASVTAALKALPQADRPVLFSISGADDLQPGPGGVIDESSPLRSPLQGFARIGVPIRQLVERSGVDAAFIYFGVIVYGPGKGYQEHFVDALKKRQARVIGKGANRLPIVHVDDAARALVHLSGLPRDELVGRTFIAADGAETTQRELLAHTATSMGRKPPGSAPTWLVSLIAGGAAAEAMTFDAHADNSPLRATGFQYRYPSHREGVPATLAELGELKG